VIRCASNFLKLHKLHFDKLVQQLARVLHGYHGHLGNLLLLQLPFQKQQPKDAARGAAEPLSHHIIDLLPASDAARRSRKRRWPTHLLHSDQIDDALHVYAVRRAAVGLTNACHQLHE
jgi:hypothetical protein